MSQKRLLKISPRKLLQVSEQQFAEAVADFYDSQEFRTQTIEMILDNIHSGERSRLDILGSAIRILESAGIPHEVEGNFLSHKGQVSHPTYRHLVEENMEHLPEVNLEQFDYRIHDFDPSSSKRFIETAYIRILKRKPDPHGYEKHLDALTSGRRHPVEVLGSIRFGKEGRKIRVRIPYLMTLFVLFKLSRVLFFKPLVLPVLLSFEYDYSRFRQAKITQRAEMENERLSRSYENLRIKHNLELNFAFSLLKKRG